MEMDGTSLDIITYELDLNDNDNGNVNVLYEFFPCLTSFLYSSNLSTRGIQYFCPWWFSAYWCINEIYFT